MLVLPPKYVNEMRMLPSTVASPTVAHAHNLMGGHTNMNIILRNNLHFRTLQLKLTPNLGSLTAPMQEELTYAIVKELPDCEGMCPLAIRGEIEHILIVGSGRLGDNQVISFSPQAGC